MSVKVESWAKTGQGETVMLTTTGGQGMTAGGAVQVTTMVTTGAAPGAPAAGAGAAGNPPMVPVVVINGAGAGAGTVLPAGPRGAAMGGGAGRAMNIQGPAGAWANGQSVTVVTKDGKEQQMGMSSMMSGNGPTRSTYQIPAGLDVDYLRFVSVARGPADKTVPFVIESIPLP